MKEQNSRGEKYSIYNGKKEGSWKGCMVSAYPFMEDGRFLPVHAQDRLQDFEKLIGKSLGSVMWYPTFADPFPAEQCRWVSDRGAIPHLTWEFFWPEEVEHNAMEITGGYDRMDKLLEGRFDDYLTSFAGDARKFGGKVLIRFLHEFNGNWYLWSGNKNGRDKGGPEKVVAVWRYVVDLFRREGAHNVKWIWNPHGPSVDVSTESWNDVEKYWPGSDYVDWMAMDAYNWFPKDPWGGDRPYRDFDNCFRALYDRCAALGDQPIMIAEFACDEFDHGGMDKPQWITQAFSKMKNEYPRLKMFLWFHINKEKDWRVNSSEQSLEAFRNAMKDPYFIGAEK